MKKTYIIPETSNFTIAASEMIAGAETLDPNQTIVNDDDIGVKKDVSSSHAYNVWNDDWSNN